MNPVDALPFYSFRAHFNIIHPSRSTSSNSSPFSHSYTNTLQALLVRKSDIKLRATYSAPSIDSSSTFQLTDKSARGRNYKLSFVEKTWKKEKI